MSTVTVTTELPWSADFAAELARKPALMAYALSPVLRFRHLDVEERRPV